MRYVALILFVSYVLAVGCTAALGGTQHSGNVTRHDRNVIRFFQHHPKLAATPAGGRALSALLPRVVRTLQARDQQRQEASAWPPHHQLWLCIHSHEASNWQDEDTGHNGHYGGLQMHPGWGYGTSYYASSDSQLVQEQAAERGYAASGYSQSWLLGQWYHPDCV